MSATSTDWSEEARRARALGFDGKWALHPSQLEPLNAVFSPSQEEFDRADGDPCRPR